MTNIGPSLTITGDVTSHEDMTVHGTIKGSVNMQEGVLVVARTGTAEANVQGSNITVHGTVAGDLAASVRLELTETAKVDATVTAPSLMLREGAVLNGTVDVWAKNGSAARSKGAATQKAS